MEHKPECINQYRYSETLHKSILCARLEPEASSRTDAWQHRDLFAGTPGAIAETVPLPSDASVMLFETGCRGCATG